MSDDDPLAITATPIDAAAPDDESRIMVEADLLEDIEGAKELDQSVEILR